MHYLNRIIRGIPRTMHLRLTCIFFLGLHLFTQSHLRPKENLLPGSDDTEQTVSIAKGKIKQRDRNEDDRIANEPRVSEGLGFRRRNFHLVVSGGESSLSLGGGGVMFQKPSRCQLGQ